MSPAWDALGRANALGAVLTRADGELGAWDSAEFFATGAADAERFVAELRALVPAISHARVLDFGCGVGRVTRALANYFGEAVGVDAAASMIERARALAAAAGAPDRSRDPAGGRCSFVLNDARDLSCFETASFTAVYSRLVLQHIRPALVKRYIPELVRVLAPGGGLMFQLPDAIAVDPARGIPVLRRLKPYVPWTAVVAWRRLKCRLSAPDKASQMTMFGMPSADVLALIADAGGRVLDVRPDTSHGCDRVGGFEYWVTR
jgi:SAM-dependent methyltransferase